MAEGLYMQGNDIMFDSQKVGEITMPEGTVQHETVIGKICSGGAHRESEISSRAFNSGYNAGLNAKLEIKDV